MYLFKSVQHFLPLAEMSEEQLQRSRHQRRVVVHGEVGQHPQEHASTFIVHFQDAVSFAAQRHTKHTGRQTIQIEATKMIFFGEHLMSVKTPVLHTQLQTWPLLALQCAVS